MNSSIVRVKKILFVAPIEGNGGIQTLVRDYIRDFDFPGYALTHIGVSQRRSTIERSSSVLRAYDGLLDLFVVYRQVRKVVSKERFDIFHTTTSGSIGTLRDFLLGRLCKRHGIKTVLHCHYGCIPQDYRRVGILGLLLKKTMRLYDNIWVLDSKSIDCLHTDPVLKDKTKLVPNPIKVPAACDFGKKEYTKVAFIGNMYRTKGILELVEAVSKLDNTTLHVAGPNYNDCLEFIRQNYADLIDKRVFFYGSLPNCRAMELLEEMDILALPTYYPWEAFPISVLEAMSRGKMVISTHRAAIPDMLTDLDGNRCGCIIDEKSSAQIFDAIKWCQCHRVEADEMCRKAYEKVKNSYETSIIYKLYQNLYDELTTYEGKP